MKTKSFCQIYGQLDQIGDRLPSELEYLFSLGLTCDASIRIEQAKVYRDCLAILQRGGGLVAPNIYPAHFDAACADSNWWKYSTKECVRLLEEAKTQFELLELGPMTAVNTYTVGNTFVSACRQMGIRRILGFCAPIVIEDGGWEISHYGSPLSPYFAGEEDYRKPEDPGERPDPVLISSMELRNPMVCLNHWGEGPWCPLNAQAADRYLEPTGLPLPFIQIAEDWLRQAELTGRPLFFHINLQYFFAGRCFEHNRQALAWLALQRDKGRLEVGGLNAWAERMKQGKGFQRQTTYWRGEMMGFHVGHRPGCFPDVIVDEDLSAQRVWQTPDPLPRRLYDYAKTWNYPAFEPKGTAPASDQFKNLDIEIKFEKGCGLERAIEIEIENYSELCRLPIAVWKALDDWEGPFEAKRDNENWSVRIVPHPSGVGGAVLAEGEAPEGRSRIGLQVKGGRISQKVYQKAWGDLIVAQTFYKDGRPYTMLAAQTPEPFVVSAEIKRDIYDKEQIRVEHLLGLDYCNELLRGGVVALRFDGTRLACWHRLWGVSADQIEIANIEIVEETLRQRTSHLLKSSNIDDQIPKPGFQIFGNIRDTTRWDRALARKIGSAEWEDINHWFRKQRPGMGDAVIEVHPGIYLPRGSITKVLGHEFDVQICAEGYGFKELCVDYPQGWDWGVSAWVQWRHLKLRIDGLRDKKGPHILHLHAFDSESRDISQRVHFFNPEALEVAPIFGNFPIHSRTELCVVKEWVLPRGVEGRWDPSALCSILIPEECRHWPSLGVWIVPLEKGHLYDWIEERGAPGLISHLWVTR